MGGGGELHDFVGGRSRNYVGRGAGGCRIAADESKGDWCSSEGGKGKGGGHRTNGLLGREGEGNYAGECRNYVGGGGMCNGGT